jgi:hypothetical protein
VGVASVLISGNPTLGWEDYGRTFPRRELRDIKFSSRDNGGFWDASFNIVDELLTRPFLSDFLWSGLARMIYIYNDRGRRVWEGEIDEVVFDSGTVKTHTRLYSIVNKSWVRYLVSGTPTRSTVYQDSVSQNHFGIIERVRTGGQIAEAVANSIAELQLDWLAWPKAKRKIRKGGSERPMSLRIACSGFAKRFKHRVYTQTASSGDADASTVIEAVVDDLGQFVVTKEIDTNSQQIPQEFDSDRWAEGILTGIAEAGDPSLHKWVWGMGLDQTFYFKQAARPER